MPSDSRDAGQPGMRVNPDPGALECLPSITRMMSSFVTFGAFHTHIGNHDDHLRTRSSIIADDTMG